MVIVAASNVVTYLFRALQALIWHLEDAGKDTFRLLCLLMEKEAELGKTYPIELPMISFMEVCTYS